MKSLFLATTVLATFASGAMAADAIVVPAPSPVPTPAIHDWSGPYVGVLGGGTFDQYRIHDGYGGYNRSFGGPALGIFGGYNWQSSNLVYGFDGSISYRFGKDTVHIEGGPGSMQTRLGLDGSLRGRIGMDMGAFLPYIAVGATTTQLRTFWPAGHVHRDTTLIGWTAAVGADVKMTDQVFLRGEYAYSNYGPKTLEYCGPVCSMSYKVQTHDFLIGVGYRF